MQPRNPCSSTFWADTIPEHRATVPLLLGSCTFADQLLNGPPSPRKAALAPFPYFFLWNLVLATWFAFKPFPSHFCNQEITWPLHSNHLKICKLHDSEPTGTAWMCVPLDGCDPADSAAAVPLPLPLKESGGSLHHQRSCDPPVCALLD